MIHMRISNISDIIFISSLSYFSFRWRRCPLLLNRFHFPSVRIDFTCPNQRRWVVTSHAAWIGWNGFLKAEILRLLVNPWSQRRQKRRKTSVNILLDLLLKRIVLLLPWWLEGLCSHYSSLLQERLVTVLLCKGPSHLRWRARHLTGDIFIFHLPIWWLGQGKISAVSSI